ncbi:MAG: hypothetical protein H6716_24685 [Polyangiaceae bacterium]|nr:hypothetical protein [Polyangiaceae bacterium]
MRGWSWAIASMAGLLAACVPLHAPIQTATPVEAGELEFTADADLIHAYDADEPPGLLPNPMLGVSYGAHERVDIGLSIGMQGIVPRSRVLVTPRSWEHLSVTLAPAFQFPVMAVYCPVLVGLRPVERFEAVLGVQPMMLRTNQNAPNAESDRFLYASTFTAGASLRLGEHWRVMPQVAYLNGTRSLDVAPVGLTPSDLYRFGHYGISVAYRRQVVDEEG